MSKVERRVRSLVREDGEMRDAVEVILDSATDGEVQWIDVRDEITSGQWGRLIEKEILVDGDTGFALADRDAIAAGLEDDDDGDLTSSDVDTPRRPRGPNGTRSPASRRWVPSSGTRSTRCATRLRAPSTSCWGRSSTSFPSTSWSW